MAARTLVTIGDLRAQPLRRTRSRRMGHIDPFRFRERTGMGSATNATAGAALQDAAIALINYLDTYGVPSEHVQDPQVLSYQKTWNADPLNAGDQLTPDGGYGPETQGTLNAMTGGLAPNPNTGGGTTPVPSPSPSPAPVVPSAPAAEHDGMTWLLIAAAVVGGAWLLFRKKKSVHHHHRSPGAIVEVKSNPRRRRSARRAELFA